MIKSMTGFGYFEAVSETYKMTVEIKSVNHRYLDLNIRMPKKFNCFEAGIRNILKSYILRGKVDIFINYESYVEDKTVLRCNKKLAKEYMECFNQLSKELNIDNDITLSKLSQYPEIIVTEHVAEEEDNLWDILAQVLYKAAENFVEARSIEGEQLRVDLTSKLDEMIKAIHEIEVYAPQIIADYKVKLTDKVSELLENRNIDENRIITEVTIFADKICVDEEIVRLKSHIESVKSLFEDGVGVGRQLDFIAQEMNREANTILSKSNDLKISDRAILLKTEIEKIREQIQNIE
jgi:TIGR00255 family protein